MINIELIDKQIVMRCIYRGENEEDDVSYGTSGFYIQIPEELVINKEEFEKMAFAKAEAFYFETEQDRKKCDREEQS